jgi:hypothetical protein
MRRPEEQHDGQRQGEQARRDREPRAAGNRRLDQHHHGGHGVDARTTADEHRLGPYVYLYVALLICGHGRVSAGRLKPTSRQGQRAVKMPGRFGYRNSL